MHEIPTCSTDPSGGMIAEEGEALSVKLMQEFSQSKVDYDIQTSIEDHLEGEKDHGTKHVPTSL